MEQSDRGESRLVMAPYRIQALTDGIFAISMTLLVLSLDMPQKEQALDQRGLFSFILSQGQDLFNYALSFVLLAVFWLIHHQQFHFIKRVDRRLIWINILTLMTVGLVPFATSLLGDYPAHSVAELLFALNMFVLGFLFYWNWSYAAKGHRLIDPGLDRAYIYIVKKRNMVLPLISLCAVVLSGIRPLWASYAYVAAPIILFLPQFDISLYARTHSSEPQ